MPRWIVFSCKIEVSTHFFTPAASPFTALIVLLDEAGLSLGALR